MSALRSLLVLRDGHECGDETEAIEDARKQLVRPGFLTEDTVVHVVDFHKSSEKGVRLWESDNGTRSNVLEGTTLFLDEKKVVLANMGIATLHQGTANPIMLIANGDGIKMLAVAADVFSTAQLNYSSPRVAQQLPLPSKRTEDELKNRAAQEIRRTR